MSSKDYYVILGISPGESAAGVKSAYRDLARRYHPDRAGPQSTRRFQEVAEAYNVLGDRERRSAYDASRGGASVEIVDEPMRDRPHRAPVEPLDAEPASFAAHRAAPAEFKRWSIMDDFMAPYAARDAIFHHFRRSLTDRWLAKSGRIDALNLGIHLTPEEARGGVDVELGIPVFLPCRSCHGSGHLGFYSCPHCHETGWFETEETVVLHIPPMVRDGALIQVPLRGLGIEDMLIRVLIRVRD